MGSSAHRLLGTLPGCCIPRPADPSTLLTTFCKSPGLILQFLLCQRKFYVRCSALLCPAHLSSACNGAYVRARAVVQEAMKDAEAVVKERAAVASKIRALQAKLEEEARARAALKDKAQRKLSAAEQEVGNTTVHAPAELMIVLAGLNEAI